MEVRSFVRSFRRSVRYGERWKGGDRIGELGWVGFTLGGGSKVRMYV